MPADAQQHRIQLSNTATVAATPGHPGFTAVKKESARGSIVVEQRVNAQGHTRVDAYRQVVSRDGHTTTRVYTDGRRSIDAANFHSTGRVNGPQFLRYHNGLRAAYAQNGRPLYSESFTNKTHSNAMVRRTYYGVGAGVDRYYAVSRVRGYDTYVYQPVFYAAPEYALFYSALAFPILVGPRCLVCPDVHAVFEVPPSQYSDPMELLGDMQISEAVTDDGVAPVEGQAADPSAPIPNDGTAVAPDQPPTDQAQAQDTPPPPPPELVEAAASGDATDLGALKQQAGELQSQALARVKEDPALATPAADQPAQVIEAAPAPGGDTLAVSEDVRSQIHKQVRLSLAEHAQAHPLTLIDIIQSGYSRIYLFQVAAAIDTVSAITGDGCALGSGDLIAFTSLGDSQRPTAQMKVVAARGGHCLSQDLVEVSVGDLQEMLNTFNQRLEENMRKLHACTTAKDGCVHS